MNSLKYGILALFFLFVGCSKALITEAIYDKNADAHHDVASAIASAKESSRNIVLIFGANW